MLLPPLERFVELFISGDRYPRVVVCKASSVDLVPVAVIEDLEQQPNGFIRWMREINGVGHWRPMVASWAGSEVGRKRIVAESFDLVNRISAISPSGRLKCQAKEEGHCVSHGSPHELI